MSALFNGAKLVIISLITKHFTLFLSIIFTHPKSSVTTTFTAPLTLLS